MKLGANKTSKHGNDKWRILFVMEKRREAGLPYGREASHSALSNLFFEEIGGRNLTPSLHISGEISMKIGTHCVRVVVQYHSTVQSSTELRFVFQDIQVVFA